MSIYVFPRILINPLIIKIYICIKARDCVFYCDSFLQRWSREGERREEEERSDKVRGFYRPPAATMVVGRRKLLALVANDRRPETSTLRDSDFVE